MWHERPGQRGTLAAGPAAGLRRDRERRRHAGPALRERGVRIILASVGSSTLELDELISVFDEGQFAHLQKPYNQVMGIAHAHQARWPRS